MQTDRKADSQPKIEVNEVQDGPSFASTDA